MSQANQQPKPTKVEGRDCPVALACYVHVWEARPNQDPTKKPKFGVCLVWPKTTDLSALKRAAGAAARQKWGDKMPANMKSPFRDGDIERGDDPNFKGSIFMNVRSEQKQAVVDVNKVAITDQMAFYSGCKCKIALNAFSYENSGNKGVSFGMGAIQKISDGPRLSGQSDPDNEFDNVDAPAGTGSDDPLLF